jgi:hypothetical protein
MRTRRLGSFSKTPVFSLYDSPSRGTWFRVGDRRGAANGRSWCRSLSRNETDW